jgi:hypothetical protein
VKELALWRAASVVPAPGWYLESGADQATTLHLADERGAYALADLPTFAKLGGLASHVLFAADTTLTNPYTLYVVRRLEPHPNARDFAMWATHAGREGVLALRLPDGTAAFVTRPGECEAPTLPRATRSPAPPSAATLLGRWEYVAPRHAHVPTPPTLSAGLQVTLEVDSAAGRTAYGRVGRWFAGDMGLPPTAFAGITAVLDDSARLIVTIPAARAGVPGFTIVASQLGSDTLQIIHALRGNDAGPFAEGPGALFVRTSGPNGKP